MIKRVTILSVAVLGMSFCSGADSAQPKDYRRVAETALRLALEDAGFTVLQVGGAKPSSPAAAPVPAAVPASTPMPAAVPAAVPAVTATNATLAVDVGGGVSVDMVWCAPGRFLMGSPADEELRKGNEAQHEETITNGFLIGRFEVTRQLWQAVTGSDPSDYEVQGDASRYPVDNVSRDMCLDFIARLNERARGVRFRLPTEAEWEYACRAGTSGPFGIGEGVGAADMQIRGSAASGHPVPCGSFRPNAWGLYDMHGNVSEWCQNAYRKTPDSRANGHVIRGGNWHERIVYARSAARLNYYSNRRSPQFGLRLAADLTDAVK